jgi:hypothetical protein
MNSYELSRNWFDFSFENPQKIKPYHSAIYFFAIEHCNRLGWKKVFGFPTSMVLEAIGMKSYNSYKRYFDDLVEFGFFKVHEYSKNQYSSNIIELTLKDKALDKALDKAFIKHGTKQVESTEQSIDSINKPIYKEPVIETPPQKKELTELTEETFLKRWCDARTYYDKLPTNIKKLTSFEKIDFNDLKKDYTLKEFEQAMQGMFQQKTFPKTRLRPTHFLKREHFETYLTCFTTKEKLYENKKFVKPIERI